VAAASNNLARNSIRSPSSNTPSSSRSTDRLLPPIRTAPRRGYHPVRSQPRHRSRWPRGAPAQPLRKSSRGTRMRFAAVPGAGSGLRALQGPHDSLPSGVRDDLIAYLFCDSPDRIASEPTALRSEESPEPEGPSGRGFDSLAPTETIPFGRRRASLPSMPDLHASTGRRDLLDPVPCTAGSGGHTLRGC
jgi:hypothetical protein